MEKIDKFNLRYRKINCREPTKRFFQRERKRRLSEQKRETLLRKGQDVNYFQSLQCKSCKTYLSPRTNGFLTYSDSIKEQIVKWPLKKL